MGARLLGRWLRYPLQEPAAIDPPGRRGVFFERSLLRPRLRQILKGLGDLERLTARVALEQATPREVAAINHALEKIPQLDHRRSVNRPPPPLWWRRRRPIWSWLPDLRELISRALVDDSPLSLKEAASLREGTIRSWTEPSIRPGGKDWIARLEAEERAATGINSLKAALQQASATTWKISRATCRPGAGPSTSANRPW